MKEQFINPNTLLTPRGYTQVVTVECPAKLIFVSGQVAADKGGKLVGTNDLSAQVKQAAENLATALKAVGATPADIGKTNTYAVNYKPSDNPVLREAQAILFPGGDPPASTMVGVTALAVEGLLVEMEAIAMVR